MLSEIPCLPAPNELLIASVDSLGKIHAASAKSSKRGTFYDYINYNGEYNLDSILDREPHRWRRQVWDKGMMSKRKSPPLFLVGQNTISS